MAEISGRMWAFFGIIVGLGSYTVNYFTKTGKFTLFIVAGAIMLLVGVIKIIADSRYNKELKQAEAEKRKMDLLERETQQRRMQEHQQKIQTYEQRRQMQQMQQQQSQQQMKQQQMIQQKMQQVYGQGIKGLKACYNCRQLVNEQDSFCFRCGARLR